MSAIRRAVILPVVLLILVLLAMLAAMFSFRIHADYAGAQAQANRLQTRLAAEAGVERVKLMLRTSRFDLGRWYQNPDELHRVIVWAEGGDPTVWGKNNELDKGTQAYRFSIVADDPSDDEHFIRLGITDESSKLNLNEATPEQLLKLVTTAVDENEEIDPQAIVDAIVDWRDGDSQPFGQAADTEGEYYRSLDKPYKIKNGRFETVEELLLVKGVTGSILYGEDFDRNGLLTANEDDGDQSFPLDNQDGQLNRGLYPYVTAISFENNVSNDQRQRVSLSSSEDTIRKQLEADFPNDPDVIEFIATTARTQAGRQGSSGRGSGPKPPAHLPGGRRRPKFIQPADPGGGKQGPESDLVPVQPDESELEPSAPSPNRGSLSGQKPGPRQQRGQGGSASPTKQPKPQGGPTQPEPTPSVPEFGGFIPRDTPAREAGNEPAEGEEAGEATPQVPGEAAGPKDEKAGQPGESGDAAKPPEPIRSPASLLRLQTGKNGEPLNNPLQLEHLAILMDRVTVEPADRQKIPGLININTAPPAVLQCLDGLSGAQIEAIVAKRPSLDPATKATTAWLTTEEIVDLETYEKIAPKITARGQQFTIESLGYADHHGMVTRLQVVVDMVGPMAQTIYYRDVTYLGGHFPIREEDKERIGVR